jgi:hemerythrin-like domain-containing protein
MSALSSLTEEHRMISELTGALQSYAARLRVGVAVDPTDLPRFAAVFRELVDYRHHEKEEGILWPLLVRNGFVWKLGHLEEVRREHSHLRYLIDVLCQAAARGSVSNFEVRRQIAEAATAFAEFKRGHMRREDEELFPSVTASLTPRALEQLALELRQFDEVTGRNSRSGQVWQFAEELVQRYSVDSGTVEVTRVDWTPVDSEIEARYGT